MVSYDDIRNNTKLYEYLEFEEGVEENLQDDFLKYDKEMIT